MPSDLSTIARYIVIQTPYTTMPNTGQLLIFVNMNDWKKILPTIAFVASLTWISGCSVHSINESPEPLININTTFSLSDNASESDNAAESDDAVASDNDNDELRTAWWKQFNRPILDGLINQALTNNWRLSQAFAVLEQADALAYQTNTDKLPSINLNGNRTQDYGSELIFPTQSSIGASLSWELDIWKRVSSAAKADRLEALARASDIQALKLALSAEVAEAMFGAIASREQLALLRGQLTLDRDLERILQLRSDEGVGSNVDLLQQQVRVVDSEALIPVAESSLAVFENRLDVLLGEIPDNKNRVPTSENLSFSSELPAIGVPASLLLNRPDLAAARFELVAADADIAAAIADRLPVFTLTGSSEYLNANDFSNPASILTARFIHPLLDWGQRKAAVKRNKAVYQERLATFTQLYLEAIEDVENALIQEIKQREFLDRLAVQKSILTRAVKAAELRFQQGVDDYQPAIIALQELRVIERNLISEQLQLLNIRINLFRAIGGPLYDA